MARPKQKQLEAVSPPKPAVYIHIEFDAPGSAIITRSEITNGISPIMLWGIAEVLRQEGGKRMLAAEQRQAVRQGLTQGSGIQLPNLRS